MNEEPSRPVGSQYVKYCNSRYSVLYEVGPMYTYLKSYILHDGYYLFNVCATYAKSLRGTNYYVIAKSLKEAKQLYMSIYGDICSVIKLIRLCDQDEAKELLDEYYKHPVIIW